MTQSKFKRKHTRTIRLTQRDKDIILALHRHRFLTTEHLQKLTDTDSRWGMNARLRLLYDHKYIDRPQAQKSLYSHSDKRPVIYALGNKGADFLKTEFNIPMPKKVYWTEKNRRVREAHIQHTLGISDFVVEIEMMCRENGNLEFIDSDNILARSPTQTRKAKYPFRWKTRMRYDGPAFDIALVPDYVFGLRDTETRKEKFYFVEIDRGTMPVSRKDMTQTSFKRKILSYVDTLERGLAKKRFGMSGFQVLTITTSEKRNASIQTVIAGVSERKFSANTFLFRPKEVQQSTLLPLGRWKNIKNHSVRIDII